MTLIVLTSHSGTALLFALFLPAFALVNCGGGDDVPPRSPASEAGAGGSGSGGSDAGFPAAMPTDPCLTAGYHFDGDSDCDVVRCPKLECECPSSIAAVEGAPLPAPETFTLTACVPSSGCLDRVDCGRLCNPEIRQIRSACEERLTYSRTHACETDDDCLAGRCREESIGKVCADGFRCAVDGHCSAGSLCRFDPGSVDDETGLPTSLGTCSDGGKDSACYSDDQCRFGSCSSGRCNGGSDGEICKTDAHCASGHCRVHGTSPTGSCVSGEAGAGCQDDGDCASGLHCTGSVCFTPAVGQSCEEDAQCESGICVQDRCRGGEPGSLCESDSDCAEGVCAGSYCSSGGLLSPCFEAADCIDGLRCAQQVCTDGSVGAPCSTTADCTVRACVRGSCSAGVNGDVCEASEHCASGRCADPAGADPGECTSGAKGAFCLYATHCVSGSCTAQHTCN